MLDEHVKYKDYRADVKALRELQDGRHQSNSTSSGNDDEGSQRADNNWVRRAKQTKMKDIPTEAATSSDTTAVYANDGSDTQKEQSPDDIDDMLDAILVDEVVAKKDSGEMLDELLKSEDSNEDSKKDAAINPWLMEPGDLEQEETIQPDTVKEEVCVEPVNPFTAFVMVNKNAEMESPAPRPSIHSPEPQRSMPSPARPSPETSPPRYLPTVPSTTSTNASPVATSDRYMPQASPAKPNKSPTAAPDRSLENSTDQSKASHEVAKPSQSHARDENPPAMQDPVFDASGETMTAAGAARSGVDDDEVNVEKKVLSSAEKPSSPLSQPTVDNSEHGTLGTHTSTDAVKENLQDWQSAVNREEAEPPSTPKRRPLPGFFEARTRSCADVDAYVTTPRTPITPMERKGPSHVVSPFNNDDDDAYILQTAFAQKRVKVVQLLIFGKKTTGIYAPCVCVCVCAFVFHFFVRLSYGVFVFHSTGLLGLAFGFLGSFYVQSSCHFLTASVSVGDNSGEFDLHYGMWKYTPLSSVFRGYSYCYKYDVQYANNTPHIPRIAGLAALLCGAYSLGVLWVYLVLGRTNSGHWNRAIYASILAGVFQALTMLFFASIVCRQNHCSIGPGAAVSIVSTVTWFFLAFEMHYNTPLSPSHGLDEIPSEEDIVASLEMSDVGRGIKAFFGRMQRHQPRHDLSTLDQHYRRRYTTIHGRGRSPGRRRRPSPARLSYQPPDFVTA